MTMMMMRRRRRRRRRRIYFSQRREMSAPILAKGFHFPVLLYCRFIEQ